jgi:hypothetical protein
MAGAGADDGDGAVDHPIVNDSTLWDYTTGLAIRVKGNSIFISFPTVPRNASSNIIAITA